MVADKISFWDRPADLPKLAVFAPKPKSGKRKRGDSWTAEGNKAAKVDSRVKLAAASARETEGEESSVRQLRKRPSAGTFTDVEEINDSSDGSWDQYSRINLPSVTPCTIL